MKKMYTLLPLLIISNCILAQLTTLKSNYGDAGGAGIGNRVVFVNFNNGSFGSTDGTVIGTIDVPSTTVVLSSDKAGLLGTKIIFVGNNAANGDEIWSSDGTIAGTTLVKDINTSAGVGSAPGAGLEGFTIVGSSLYFSATDGINGRELWKTDGTNAGTVMVKDITAGAGSSTIGFPFNYYPIGNTMYFTINGNQLWKTDGTTIGTTMLKDFSAGGATPISNMFISNSAYTFFIANDGTNGWELWRTDGTIGGTIMLQNIGAGNINGFNITPGNFWDWNFHLFNNLIFFQPNGPSSSGGKLYTTDGTIGNTTMLVDLNPSGGGFMELQNAMDRGNVFYFPAMGELYRSDGTAAGTVMVKDINPGAPGSDPHILSPKDNLSSGYTPGLFSGGRFFFMADDGTNGKELWVSDGSAAGTVLVKNIHPTGSAFGSETRYYYTKYKFYFAADNGTNGFELWETDGTTAGTIMVQDIYPGPTSSNPDFFGVANANNKMVLTATDAGGNNIYYLNAGVVPFPLSLTGFTAELRNEKTELKWTTQQEVNVSHFNIQRSITGNEFVTIGKTTAHGGTLSADYTYTDNQLSKAATYYYRLEVVDNDGRKTYSNIVTVKLRSGFHFSIIPARNQAIISVTDVDGPVTIRLTDVSGKIHLLQKQQMVNGETIKLPTANLASGIYIITLEYNGIIRSERFFR